MFEDVRHERLLKLSVSIKDADFLKQSNFSETRKKIKILPQKDRTDREY